MPDMTVREYAFKTGKSEQTIKRWLKGGRLAGYQVNTPQGFVWYVTDTPDAIAQDRPQGAESGEGAALREMIELLKRELEARDRQMEAQERQMAEKDKQIEQLHILLKDAHERMLPAPPAARSWWQKIRKR